MAKAEEASQLRKAKASKRKQNKKTKERLKVDLARVKTIGHDGSVFSTPFYTNKNPETSYTSEGEEVLNIVHRDVQIEIKDGLLTMNVCLPKLFEKHNLYHVPVDQFSIALKRLQNLLEEVEIETNYKNYASEDIEFGSNFPGISVQEEYTFLKYIAYGLYPRYKEIAQSYTEVFKRKSTLKEGLFKKRGDLRFSIYSKHIQMLEVEKIMLDINVVRMDLKFNKKLLIRELGTDNALEVNEKIHNLFAKTLAMATLKIEATREKARGSIQDFIKNFKEKGESGLVKVLRANYQLLTEVEILEAMNIQRHILNNNFPKYKKQILENYNNRVEEFFKRFEDICNLKNLVGIVKATMKFIPGKTLETLKKTWLDNVDYSFKLAVNCSYSIALATGSKRGKE